MSNSKFTKEADISDYIGGLLSRIAELEAENLELDALLNEGSMSGVHIEATEAAKLLDRVNGLEAAQTFTHRQCPNGCGYCQCKGLCERYGTGSLPTPPKGEPK